MNQALYILQALSGTMKQTNQKELADKIEKRFMEQAQKAGFDRNVYLRVPARNEGDHSFAPGPEPEVFSPCCCFNNSFVRCSGGWRPRKKGPLPDVRRRPIPEVTPWCWMKLQRHQAKATFFV